MTLVIHADSRKIILNILEGPDENNFAIPPRCEVIRRFHVSSNNDSRFVPNQELCPGVFTTNTIVDSHNALRRTV